MRIATLLGAFSVGARPLDVATAYTNPRGLTGTELGFLRVTEELRKRGHTVDTFLGDAKMRPEWASYEAVISWNEPNLFIGLSGPKRILYQMLNDFSFVQPGFDAWVDRYVGVSKQQAEWVAAHAPGARTPLAKWTVVPLGCDPELYSDRRVPGRVIHTSCLTRGAHHLLAMWPEVRRAVPHATLRLFYPWNYDSLLGIDEASVSPQGGPYHEHILEMGQRVRYIRHALERLKPMGVEHVGAVSREQMLREYSEAQVFAFPCDTVAFSEGFSCSTLEAHAAWCVPVITDCDCLGSIYRDSGCSMYPVRSERFVAGVISALTGPDTTLERRHAFAHEHTWAKTAERLEALL